MTITIKEYTVYTINSHPNTELCYEWIRNNWHDLGEHFIEYAIESLKTFADHIGATLDYAISIVPDGGECITLEIDEDITLSEIMTILDLSGNYPFTGVCYDEMILDAFRNASKNATLEDVFNDIEYLVLKSLHDEGEYIYSDEGLYDLCESNGYEFNEDGSLE